MAPPATHLRMRLVNRSLRVRLLAAFLMISSLTALAISAIFALRVSGALIRDTGRLLRSQADAEARTIGAQIDGELARLRALALSRSLRADVRRQTAGYPDGPGRETASRVQISTRDARWLGASDDDGLIRTVIGSVAASDLRAYINLQPDNAELMLTDAYGALVAASRRTTDYDQADEQWWQRAFAEGTFVSSPIYDKSSSSFGLIIAIRVRDPVTDERLGVLRTTYRLSPIDRLLKQASFNTTGRAELLLTGARLTFGSDSTAELSGSDMAALLQARTADYVQTEYQDVVRLLALAPVATSADTRTLGWEVLVSQDLVEALAPVNAERITVLVTGGIVLLVAALAALLIAELISRPLRQLTSAAERIAAGDLEGRLSMRRTDEIGRLAGSLDTMVVSLRERIDAEQHSQAERLRMQDDLIRTQESRIEELATPLIPLGRGTLLLPLIGSLDVQRVAYASAVLLAGVGATRARHVLLDLTGVRAVDGAVATLLMRMAQGVRLLGADVTLVGLRPDVARAMVALRIDLADIPVYRNLASAIEAARERDVDETHAA